MTLPSGHARYRAREDDLRDRELIERHGATIERAARRIASRTRGAVAPEDLWSAGAVGLLDAARRFESGRDVRFETFAEHRIRGAMLDELRRMDHLPRRLRAEIDGAEERRRALAQALGREPELGELAEELGVDCGELEELRALTQPHAPLDEVVELAAPAAGADDAAIHAQRVRALAAAVAGLPERLRLVLALHYDEGLTYREIAKVLGVSEPRVCQLNADALARLRGGLAGAEAR
jgi:RNA polymerase sigma factor for flagellar operon FliA